MKSRFLFRETVVPKPIEVVFEFFSKAENLNLITPSHLQFKVKTPTPIVMRKGTIIDYQLQLFRIPFNWKTEITEWNPPYSFTDSQLKGPYVKWIHQHVFKQDGKNTIMHDKVEYLSPGWIVEPLVHQIFVKNNLKEIFDYREKSLSNILKQL